MSELRTLRSLTGALSGRGDRTAVLALHKEDAEEWSYAGLADHARRLAHGLVGAGVEPGDHVALLAANRPEWIVACLAAIEAGAVVVPLDAQLGDAMLDHALSDSGARYLFTTGKGADRLGRLDMEEAKLPEPILLDADEEDERGWRRLLAEPGDGGLPEPGPDDPAALFYTSGTTGTAKGVPLSHRNMAFQLNTLLEAGLLSEDDRILLPLPLHHAYPFVIGMLTPFAAGLPVVLPHALTGPQIVRALQEGDVSLVVGVPRLYDALYSGIEQRIKSSSRAGGKLFDAAVGTSAWVRRKTGLRVGRPLLRPLRKRFGPRLDVLASGGAALDPDLATKLEALGWRVAVGYGLTETSPLLTLNPPEEKDLGSVGEPISGIEVLLDPSAIPDESEDGEDGSGGGEEGRTDEPNEEGEILARGPSIFAGYRNMPDETEEVFTEDGWYRTGDLGYFDEDGRLYVTGRASTLIVTEGGKNVQPEEVEEGYTEEAAIGEIGVLEKGGRLVAVIMPDMSEIQSGDGGADVGDAVRDAVEEASRRLPSYQRLSDYAITREPLEYTQLGKLRRHLLEDRYERAKNEEESPDEAGPIPPEEMSEEDQALLEDPAAEQAWDWLAEHYPDAHLTPDTSPQLDLGIDSMEWVNLTMELGQRTGVELDEEAIERISTVRDLLDEVAEAGEAGSVSSPLEEPEEVLDDEQKKWLEPLGPGMSALARGLYTLNRVAMRALFRLRVEGLEHLPEEGPFIVTPNHTSYLDAFVVGAALDYELLRGTYWAGWTGAAFGNPVTRLVSRLAQTVPVDPSRAGVSSLAFGAAVLTRGKNLVWFPEGRRSPDGRLQSFKPGIGMLLDHFRVPVVPVSIEGTYGAMPPGKALPRPKKVAVVFGEPIGADELEERGEGEGSQERLVGGLRDRVAELTGQS